MTTLQIMEKRVAAVRAPRCQRVKNAAETSVELRRRTALPPPPPPLCFHVGRLVTIARVAVALLP